MTGSLKTLEETNVQFVTWNCKGLNGAVKRGNILAHLRKLGADVAFLQETHLKNHAHKQLYKNWIGHVFHSKFNCKSRGKAIIINKSIPFTTSDIISDPNGRYIIVTGKLYNTPVTLANIYAPNYDDEKFINSVLAILPNLHSHNLILAGDFNLVMDTVLDRSSSRQQSVSKSAKLIQNFLKSANLIEAWRYLNPTTKKVFFLFFF